MASKSVETGTRQPARQRLEGLGMRLAPIAVGFGALAVAAAIAVGYEVSHGSGTPAVLGLAGGAFLVWAAARPEHAALSLIVVLPFLIYPAQTGGLSLFAGAGLALAVSILLLLTQRHSMARLHRKIPL